MRDVNKAALPADTSDLNIAWRLALGVVRRRVCSVPVTNNHTIVTSAPLARSGAASGMLGSAWLTGQTTGAVVLSALFSV